MTRTGGGIYRFGTAFPYSSCIAHQFYLLESRCSYIPCAGRISLFDPLKSIKVSKRNLNCRFYLPTIAPALRYLKTSSSAGCPYPIPSVIGAPSYVLLTCTFLLRPFRPPRTFPPTAPPLSPLLSPISRLDACSPPVPISYLPATPSQFAMFLPSDRTCPRISLPVAVSPDSAHIASPSMPPARSDIAAARPSRRMAPRGAGRASLTYPFGAGRHDSRWCLPDMLDAIHDARVPAGHWGSRYPILIWRCGKRAECGICVETSASCNTECIDILRFQSKFHSVRFRPVRSGAYYMLGMGMALPRVLESWSGHRPWRLGASPLIAGRRGGRGENRMSLEDTWHVVR